MARAWHIRDDSQENPRSEHYLNPPEWVDLNQLYEKSGVKYLHLGNDGETRAKLDKIKEERNYNYEDQVELSPSTLPKYEETLKMFCTEHLHADEEIRYVEAGSGYFDIRDIHDHWIRIEAHVGDLLILPAGIYHCFTLDSNNYIKAKRFFSGEPVWTAYYRPADNHEARKRYLELVGLGFKTSAARY